MDSNLNKKEKKKVKLTALNEMGIVLCVCGFFLMIMLALIKTGEMVPVNTYNLVSPIEITTFDVGTKFMEQTITFKDESGEWVVLEEVLYEGSTEAETIYVYKVGSIEFLTNLRYGYKYYVTDTPIEENVEEE